MPGTLDGGRKAAATNKLKYGDNYFAVIGAKGGKNGHTGGFAFGDIGKRRARVFGHIGGKKSRRLPMTPEQREAARLRREARERTVA